MNKLLLLITIFASNALWASSSSTASATLRHLLPGNLNGAKASLKTMCLHAIAQNLCSTMIGGEHPIITSESCSRLNSELIDELCAYQAIHIVLSTAKPVIKITQLEILVAQLEKHLKDESNKTYHTQYQQAKDYISQLCKALRKKDINKIADIFDDKCSLCGTVEFNLVSRSCHTGCIPAGTALLSLNSECCVLLHIATCHNNLGYAQMLVDNCPPDNSLILNQNPLQMAALRGYFEMVQLLLTHDTTDINRKDYEGNTALSLAILNNHEQTASWLIQKGADIYAPNQRLEQPIHFASYQGMNELLLLLLEKGADTAAQSSELETPLHFTFYGGGNLECAKTLLKNNAPLNTKNNKGQTPLHSCVMHSKEHQTLVLELIAAGALMNEADKDGNTPLHLALLTRSPECIDTLITRGARTDIPNFAGQTALQLLEARRQL